MIAGAQVWGFLNSRPARRATHVTSALVGAVWSGLLLLRLLVPSTVGLADETDGHRYLCQLGLATKLPYNAFSTLYWHVYTTYQPHTWYGETCGTYRGDETKYASSFEAVIWLGKRLNPLFGMPGALDLRTLAILYALVIGVALGLTFALLPGAVWVRLLLTTGIGLAYTESVVAVYFISPYAEPVVWCGFALLLPALLWYWRAPRVTWPRLAVVAGLALFIITAKTQAAGYLPAIMLALLWKRPAGVLRAASTVRGRFVNAGRALFLHGRALLVCLLLLAGTGLFMQTGGNTAVYSQVDTYEMVFTTLLPAGHDPAADLKWMGADPGLAYASGTTVVSPNGAAADPRLLAFNREVSEATVLEFIAAHPLRLYALTEDGLHALGQWRPGYLGNYTDSPQHPDLQLECRDCFYYYLFTPARHTPAWFGVFLLLTAFVGWRLRRGKTIPPANRLFGKVAMFFVLAAVGEFWLVSLTQGVGDNVKHHVFTLLPITLCVPAFLGCLLLRRRDPAPAEPDVDVGAGEARQPAVQRALVHAGGRG